MWNAIKNFFYRIGATVAIFLMWRRIKREPYQAPFWELQTELYLIKGDVDKARETIDRALELFPDNERLLVKLQRVEEHERKMQVTGSKC